jgi:hypothetical protein
MQGKYKDMPQGMSYFRTADTDTFSIYGSLRVLGHDIRAVFRNVHETALKNVAIV